jgi:hypothetical protein
VYHIREHKICIKCSSQLTKWAHHNSNKQCI